MKGILAAAVAAIVLVGAGYAEDKKDAKKIDPAKLVGKWELTKSTDDKAPKGALVDFTKDGKVNIKAEADGMKFEFSGTYKLDGDQLTITISANGKESSDTDTVKSLTDDKIVLIDKDKKETELTKKK